MSQDVEKCHGRLSLSTHMFKRSLYRLELKCFPSLLKCCLSLRSPVVLSLRVVLLPVVLPGLMGSYLMHACILIFKQTLKMTLMQISGTLSLHIFLLSATLFFKLQLLPELQSLKLSKTTILCLSFPSL